MTISKKILDEITNLPESKEYKNLLIELLNIEDKGNHRNTKAFEQKVTEYLDKKEDKN